MRNSKTTATANAIDLEDANLPAAQRLDAPVEAVVAVVDKIRGTSDLERLVARVRLPRTALDGDTRAEALVALVDLEIKVGRGAPGFAARGGARRERVAAEEEVVAVGALLDAVAGGCVLSALGVLQSRQFLGRIRL